MTRLDEKIHEDLIKPVIQKLFAASIFTTIGFVQTESGVLSNLTGLSYSKILQIKSTMLHKYSSPIRYGHNYYQELLTHGAIISTNVKSLDYLLGGGLLTGKIYEICGLSASGKTQLCMSIVKNVSSKLKKQGILFISTKNDVFAHRFHAMIGSEEKNTNALMHLLKIYQVTSAYELLALLQKISKELKTSTNQYRLIVIDSINTYFYHFLGELQNEGLCLLNNISNILSYIAVEYHTVILVTNLITSWTTETNFNEANDDEDYFPLGTQITRQPALGKYWAHIPDTRIIIQKLNNNSECLLTILKSTNEPVGKTVKISISNEGIK